MEESVVIHGKTFKPYMTNEQVVSVIDDIAVKLNKDLEGKNPLFMVVLNGAFVFASELIMRFNGPCEITFIRFSSYEGTSSSNIVREVLGLDTDVKGRTIVIIEDIIDTGLTMLVARDKLKAAGAEEVLIATLLYKPKAFKHNYYINYIGIEIPNDFIIGFGLDFNGQGRNLRDIYKIAE